VIRYDGFPPLDCHAHVAPNVTPDEVVALGEVIVIAVTRSLDEAEVASSRRDGSLVWGCGVHPARLDAREGFDLTRFRRLLQRFAVVGECGLDRRGGNLPLQRLILRSVLEAVTDEPVLMSLHSNGCVGELLELLSERPHQGAILHWFLGDSDAVHQAVRLGCYFSVNGAMTDEQLMNIPLDRMLPETDFPSTKKRGGGGLPGDTMLLERRVARLHGLSEQALRGRWFRTLRDVSHASGAIDRLPENVVDLLLSA
jgi:TatD DNase family protein